MADIVGWGATTESGPTSSILLKTTITVETKEECIAEYGDEIEFGLICAKTNQGDACNVGLLFIVICYNQCFIYLLYSYSSESIENVALKYIL